MPEGSEVKTDVKWAIALLILSLLAFSAALMDLHAPPTNDWWTSYQELPQDGNENLTAITGQLLESDTNGTYAASQGQLRAAMPLIMPFEVLGLLLTVALIGALTVAMRDPEDGEEVHGQTPTPPGRHAKLEGGER